MTTWHFRSDSFAIEKYIHPTPSDITKLMKGKTLIRLLVPEQRILSEGNSILYFKVIPQYCMRIPTANDFCVISTRKISACTYTGNERNFPQAKLASEINARFPLNEDGDLYFLLHNNFVHVVLLNLKEH